MAKKMLIDATHPEETRVAIVENNKLVDLDFESVHKRQIKSNIYLAKVTRVEPSLQAAFVEYGADKQGFLPFSEIHPDYFKIPVADREALIAAQSEQQSSDDDDTEDSDATDAAAKDEDHNDGESTETVGNDDADMEEELEYIRPKNLAKQYKIQEVIKKRQILLVQVTKEERGNKGAALTTYLSLAGRYCVLMPNSLKGGGISRKNNDTKDRKRLKKVLDELDIPDGIAVIVRTAGAGRTKLEIKRDYEYLLKMWATIREETLSATAPALIYEEGDLIKRALRDLYSRDTEEVHVAGEERYKDAKDLMKMLIPSHARRVQLYKDPIVPLFAKYQVEKQLDEIFETEVSLPSGGYLVLNQTEALVSVDVNSGKAIRERNIEETALATNKEAAVEVARQLKLRDLAGLVVIDFIDMDDRRNNRVVEGKLKEALKGDRARIQVGRISNFGLLEMSRQRLRPSIMEMSTRVCDACHGTGRVRSVASTALKILRTIEEEGVKNRTAYLQVKLPANIALYLFNEKREALAAIEENYHFRIVLEAVENLPNPGFTLEALEKLTKEEREQYHTDSHDELEKEQRQGQQRGRRSNRDRNKPERNKPKSDEQKNSRGRNRHRSNDDDQKPDNDELQADDAPKKRRRRRRRKPDYQNDQGQQDDSTENNSSNDNEQSVDQVAAEKPAANSGPKNSDQESATEKKALRKRQPRRKPAAKDSSKDQTADASEDSATSDAATPATEKSVKETSAEEKAEKPKAAPKLTEKKVETSKPALADKAADSKPATKEPVASEPVDGVNISVVDEAPSKPKKGWWSKVTS